VKFCDERSAFQDFPHDFALNADAASMNDAHKGKSSGVRLVKIRFDGPLHVARCECMEIEGVLYRKVQPHLAHSRPDRA
jgi:hypothetical protein